MSTVTMTVKEKKFGTFKILSVDLNKDLQRACRHIFNIRHQYKALRYLRENLSHEERVIQIDFSENYNCKYSEEIQSVHFGASQRQISLHSGVAYSSSEIYPFCTISDCLKHGPAAIWAHMDPVIVDLRNATNATRIHFISDGPTTQYRNKHNFYLLSRKVFHYGFTSATWNFLEAGHGKGAADGIGAVIKRTADAIVSVRGNDITNGSDLLKELSNAKTSFKLYEVKESAIEQMESEIQDDVKPIPKTMQIHQVHVYSNITILQEFVEIIHN